MDATEGKAKKGRESLVDLHIQQQKPPEGTGRAWLGGEGEGSSVDLHYHQNNETRSVR